MTFADQVQTLLDSASEVAVKQPEAISLLNSVYKQLFGEQIKKQCGDCLTKAMLRIRKFVYLQSQNVDFNLETMKKHEDKNFVIKKGKALDVMSLGIMLTNDNLDDATAFTVLTAYPNLIKYFEKYPTDKDGNLDLTGFEASSSKGGKPSEEEVEDLIRKNAQAAAALTGNTPVVPVIKIEPEKAAVPVVKTEKAETKEKSAATKPNPAKAAANRLPIEGETIEAAAARFEVSARTIERDMKAAGINVADWKAKTVASVDPAPITVAKPETAPSEEQKQEGGEEGQADKKEGEEGDNDSGFVDFVVTQEWLDEHAEEAAANDIKLGEVIEVPVGPSAE